MSHQPISCEKSTKTLSAARRRPVEFFLAPPDPAEASPGPPEGPRQDPVGYGFWNPPPGGPRGVFSEVSVMTDWIPTDERSIFWSTTTASQEAFLVYCHLH